MNADLKVSIKITHSKMASAVSLTLKGKKKKQATQDGKLFGVCRININSRGIGCDCFSCPQIMLTCSFLLPVLFSSLWIAIFPLTHTFLVFRNSSTNCTSLLNHTCKELKNTNKNKPKERAEVELVATYVQNFLNGNLNARKDNTAEKKVFKKDYFAEIKH